jgi:hypothetical protein
VETVKRTARDYFVKWGEVERYRLMVGDPSAKLPSADFLASKGGGNPGDVDVATLEHADTDGWLRKLGEAMYALHLHRYRDGFRWEVGSPTVATAAGVEVPGDIQEIRIEVDNLRGFPSSDEDKAYSARWGVSTCRLLSARLRDAERAFASAKGLPHR